MSIDRRDDRDEKTDVGRAPGRGETERSPGHAEFDREIDVRGVLWTGIVLVAVAVVVHLLIWGLLRGFSSFDEKRDVRLTPIETASPQQPPPEPRLQGTPASPATPNEDMDRMREDEDYKLGHAGWVNRQQGIVRVPIDVAIDVILSRGVSAAQSASPPKPSPPQPSSPGGRGGRTAGQRSEE